MELKTVGKNIRKFRVAKKLTIEKFAELANLSPNYISMIERGERTPSLETFIDIVNALGVSADMVLSQVVEASYTVKNTMLDEKLSNLPSKKRDQIYEIIDVLTKE